MISSARFLIGRNRDCIGKPLLVSVTLGIDATLVPTHKRDALYCYKKFKVYPLLNCWWAEQGTMLYSEFRDGNLPHEQLRVLTDCLRMLRACREGADRSRCQVGGDAMLPAPPARSPNLPRQPPPRLPRLLLYRPIGRSVLRAPMSPCAAWSAASRL